MKHWKTMFLAASAFIFLLTLSCQTVYANSSWVWLTDRRPYQLLPAVAVFTVLFETCFIKAFLKIRNILKLFAVVLAGNLLSFLIPYAFGYLEWTQFHGKNIFEMFEHLPYYIIGPLYLIFTLVIEIPVLLKCFKKELPDIRKGAVVIGAANVITTLVVFVIERYLCYGQW